MSYLYHLVADDLRGDHLLPLAMLATDHPDVHEREMQKWVGRESVLDVVVPHLGVTWAETVNLAALHPAHLVAARRRLGIPVSRLLQRRVLALPVARLAGLPAVEYDTRSHWRNSRPGRDAAAAPPAADFTPFDVATYRELTEVPPLHLEYLVEQRDAGEPALGLVFVKHVLVAGPVDVRGLEPTSLR